MSTVLRGLQAVRARIAQAADAAGRDPRTIELLAVSKTFPASAVLEAIDAGQFAFGENYAQEGVEKRAQVEALLRARAVAGEPGAAADAGLPAVYWHYIGPIQSNKTRLIAEHFDWVHSVDRVKVAQRLGEARPPNAPALQICIQVNVSGETSKSGVAPQDVYPLARAVLELPRLRLRGLMTIPRPTPEIAEQRAQLRVLRMLRDELAGRGLALDTLSMGMSDDVEAAVSEGATLVRVGRAIFGDRPAR